MEDLMNTKQCEITEQDLRTALEELKGYVDVTEEDLMKIYSSALIHAKERLKHAITVADLMTKDVVTVKKETTLIEAARRLTGLRISGMPVIDDKDMVIGVVCELDIISAVGGQKSSGVKNIFRRMLGEPVPTQKEGNTVGDVMSTPPITIRPSEDIREAAHILAGHRIKRIPVVDGGRAVGGRAVTLRVVAEALAVRAVEVSLDRRPVDVRGGAVHLEARHNYESLDTGSLFVGWTFETGSTLVLEATAMVGAVFGELDGIAPGYELTLSYDRFSLYDEGEYVVDLDDSAENFLYNWLELTYTPLDWLRFGLVAQRTRAYETGLDVQRGLLAGVTYKNAEFAVYLFNPGGDDGW